MARRRPNYGFERQQRAEKKAAKKQAKLEKKLARKTETSSEDAPVAPKDPVE
ncbi:MAG: hypothetical protein MJE12_00690 [Alphaproteobacteria bacterium]|nr:hypothetical protein [Alphaproteobacteria bacterium]